MEQEKARSDAGFFVAEITRCTRPETGIKLLCEIKLSKNRIPAFLGMTAIKIAMLSREVGYRNTLRMFLAARLHKSRRSSVLLNFCCQTKKARVRCATSPSGDFPNTRIP